MKATQADAQPRAQTAPLAVHAICDGSQVPQPHQYGRHAQAPSGPKAVASSTSASSGAPASAGEEALVDVELAPEREDALLLDPDDVLAGELEADPPELDEPPLALDPPLPASFLLDDVVLVPHCKLVATARIAVMAATLG